MHRTKTEIYLREAHRVRRMAADTKYSDMKEGFLEIAARYEAMARVAIGMENDADPQEREKA
jgi:hypothetical protein